MTNNELEILLVEDNPGDIRLTEEAFNEGQIQNTLHVVTTAGEALNFVYQRGEYVDSPRPNLILLDLNLTGITGHEVLDTMKSDPDLCRIPIIVLTSSEAEEDLIEAYSRHTNAYVTKPVDPDEFIDLVRTFEAFWLSLVKLPPEDS